MYALGLLAAASVFTGCSNAAQSAAAIVPASQSIVRPAYVGVGKAAIEAVNPDLYVQRLYVTDSSARVDVLNSSFNWINNITGNTPCPSGAWVNRTGPARLYVADFGCNGVAGVSEFKTLGTSPYGTFQFNYTTSLVDPLFVTTGGTQHVYVSDNGGSQVVEFAQQSNVVLNHCTTNPNTYPRGIAVDAGGDVFVATLQPFSPMQIIKYPGPGGLSNCSAGVPIAATFPAGSVGSGLLLDNSNNLIACDQANGGVYRVTAPSYGTAVLISTTATFQCVHMSLNANGNHLFITEPFKSPPDIQIIKYPNGVVLPPLVPGSSNNFMTPVGVAAYPG